MSSAAETLRPGPPASPRARPERAPVRRAESNAVRKPGRQFPSWSASRGLTVRVQTVKGIASRYSHLVRPAGSGRDMCKRAAELGTPIDTFPIRSRRPKPNPRAGLSPVSAPETQPQRLFGSGFACSPFPSAPRLTGMSRTGRNSHLDRRAGGRGVDQTRRVQPRLPATQGNRVRADR